LASKAIALLGFRYLGKIDPFVGNLEPRRFVGRFFQPVSYCASFFGALAPDSSLAYLKSSSASVWLNSRNVAVLLSRNAIIGASVRNLNRAFL
jgi:hypothetical protein